MIVEIRRYEIEPGRREEFVHWFESEALPAMRAAGANILGVFVGVEDPNSFYYLKGFESEADRALLNQAFYGSEIWLETLRDRALEMEVGYEVALVRSTAESPI